MRSHVQFALLERSEKAERPYVISCNISFITRVYTDADLSAQIQCTSKPICRIFMFTAG